MVYQISEVTEIKRKFSSPPSRYFRFMEKTSTRKRYFFVILDFTSFRGFMEIAMLKFRLRNSLNRERRHLKVCLIKLFVPRIIG